MNASGKSDFCISIHLGLFQTKAPYQEIRLDRLKLPDLPIDRRVRVVLFQNPKFFSALTYCKAESYRDRDEAGPSYADFSLSHLAEEITKEELATLEAWLKTAKGKDCAKIIEDDVKKFSPHLGLLMGSASRLVVLNPAAWLKEKVSLSTLVERLGERVNLARIRELYLRCRDLQEWAGFEWQDLKAKERESIRSKNPEIDWLDPNAASLELLLQRYRHKSIELREHATQCDLI
mgnify:CR=1 FL=1